jgi:hypothetical protein
VRVQQLPEFLLKADNVVVGFLLRDARRDAKAIAAWGTPISPLQGWQHNLG